jgi:hypothetical protein
LILGWPLIIEKDGTIVLRQVESAEIDRREDAGAGEVIHDKEIVFADGHLKAIDGYELQRSVQRDPARHIPHAVLGPGD